MFFPLKLVVPVFEDFRIIGAPCGSLIRLVLTVFLAVLVILIHNLEKFDALSSI